MMGPEQWRPIAALIDNLWKDEFDEVREAAYFRALGHLEPEHVQQAVLNIAGAKAITSPRVSTGGTYLPAAQTIAVEATAIARIGTWPWAREQLHRLLTDVRSVAEDRMISTRSIERFVDTDVVVPFASLQERCPAWGPRICELVEELGVRGLVLFGFGEHNERLARVWWARRAMGPDAHTAGELVEATP